jgi:hypothetical protein
MQGSQLCWAQEFPVQDRPLYLVPTQTFLRETKLSKGHLLVMPSSQFRSLFTCA